MPEPSNVAVQRDHPGQHVKVCWPGEESAYGSGAAWVEYAADGTVSLSRRATPEEVRWWLSYQQQETIATYLQNVCDRLDRVMNYGVTTYPTATRR